jgi:hypothetical protein
LQIEQGVHDFRDLNQPRNGLEFFEKFVVVVGVHRSVNYAKRDCVHPNTVSQEFHRQCAVKRRNGGLGEHRQRNRRAGQRLIRQNRRDAYDMAGLLFAHLRDHFLRDEKVTRNVCANHQLKVRRRIVGERLINVDARVVDQEINAVKMFDGGIGHFYG